MKKIYVTVAEFLENGGKLEAGRELFNSHQNRKGVVVDAENSKIKTDTGFTTVFDHYLSQVQIYCTPIYV